MDVQQIILIVLLCMSGISAIISILQFMQVGKPLNSLYKGGDAKPYFRMSGVIFAMITGINLLNAATVWLETSWLTILICPLISVMMIYTYVTAQKLR
ncbi:MAG: hypothetical protein IK130_06755 [Oscillospiraceae bacterium]|nr:hypothetical protein [Oscillospiraceae bacterium]